MKIKALIVCLLLATSLHANGPKTYGELNVTEVIKVIDGDTIKVNIDHVHPLIGERISVRLAGIDTPEMSSTNKNVRALALKAKTFTESLVDNAHSIRLTNLRRDKYFRILAEVILDGESLSDKLLKSGLALPYKGGKKSDWSHVK